MPTTYFYYKGNYYRIIDGTDGLALNQLKADGTWYQFDPRAKTEDVARNGEKLTTKEINEEITRRRCAAGDCKPAQPKAEAMPGTGESY